MVRIGLTNGQQKRLHVIRRRFVISVSVFLRKVYLLLSIGAILLSPRSLKLDGAGEARLIALCCSEPPEGFGNWTLRLLSDKLVEFDIW